MRRRRDEPDPWHAWLREGEGFMPRRPGRPAPPLDTATTIPAALARAWAKAGR
jgi:hypothetical protein